mmetsp:Transcript_18181/g.23630  ORF Transcript_18181/g.23630 Transcript_18181/m.23630 type:complete len:230 (+) Transcript_18181:50-739(+)
MNIELIGILTFFIGLYYWHCLVKKVTKKETCFSKDYTPLLFQVSSDISHDGDKEKQRFMEFVSLGQQFAKGVFLCHRRNLQTALSEFMESNLAIAHEVDFVIIVNTHGAKETGNILINHSEVDAVELSNILLSMKMPPFRSMTVVCAQCYGANYAKIMRNHLPNWKIIGLSSHETYSRVKSNQHSELTAWVKLNFDSAKLTRHPNAKEGRIFTGLLKMFSSNELSKLSF